MRYHVTLRASLARGELYWVCDVEADDEDGAMDEAEAAFMDQLEDEAEWSFEEADVEPL